jgi:hypothetical protein
LGLGSFSLQRLFNAALAPELLKARHVERLAQTFGC